MFSRVPHGGLKSNFQEIEVFEILDKNFRDTTNKICKFGDPELVFV